MIFTILILFIGYGGLCIIKLSNYVKHFKVADPHTSLVTGRDTRSKVDKIVYETYKEFLNENVEMFIGSISKVYNKYQPDLDLICNDMIGCKLFLYPFLKQQDNSYVYKIGTWKSNAVKSQEHFNMKMDAVISKKSLDCDFNYFEKHIINQENIEFIHLTKKEISTHCRPLEFLFHFEKTVDAQYISLLVFPLDAHAKLQQDYIFVAFVNGDKVFDINIKDSSMIEDIRKAISTYSWYN